MWNAPILNYCLLFTFLLPDWKDSKGKVNPCELVGTHLWVDRFFGSTLKMLSKEANYFDLFYVPIHIETSGSTLKKKCCLIRNLTCSLEWNAVRKVCTLGQKEKCYWMHANFPSRQTNININFWVMVGGRGGGGGEEEVLWFFGQECPMWPKSPYRLPLHVQLQFY